MIAFDRDGTVIGSTDDFAANHPRHIRAPEDQRINPAIANWLNQHSGIIISNQDGPSRYGKSPDDLMAEFEWLMAQIPGLQACLWSVSVDGVDGKQCHYLTRENGQILPGYALDPSVYGGSFRKPSTGMIQLAQDLGYDITTYVGDLSGLSEYADGRDSDRQFANRAGLTYVDVRDFLWSSHLMGNYESQQSATA